MLFREIGGMGTANVPHPISKQTDPRHVEVFTRLRDRLGEMMATSDREAELLKSALESVVASTNVQGENVAASILQTAMASHGK